MRFIAAVLAALILPGCSTPNLQKDMARDRENVQKELQSEMSLKADREKLQELRQEIPPEKQKSNDELALYLGLMRQGTEQPQVVRDKFNVLVERKRTSFREKVQRLRENYRRDEAARRDTFLEEQKSERSSFQGSKHKPNETRDFFSKQDHHRQNFFADERARRSNFESDVTAQSRDFDSYMREKVNEFNEEYRLYSKKFSERPKDKKAVTGETSGIKGMDDVPAMRLGTED